MVIGLYVECGAPSYARLDGASPLTLDIFTEEYFVMDNLEKLHNDLIRVDHQQLSLLHILDILEIYCETNRQEDMFYLVCHLKLCISAIHEHTNESINFLERMFIDARHQAQ